MERSMNLLSSDYGINNNVTDKAEMSKRVNRNNLAKILHFY
jgi:hypothetical protein